MEKKIKLPPLTTQILCAAVLGIAFGILTGPWASHLKFIGDIFVNLIMMAIIPMVMSAIAVSFVGSGGKVTGKMSCHTFKYIILFTFISAFVGLGLGLLIRPGADIVIEAGAAAAPQAAQAPSLVQSVLGFLPSNVFAAMSAGNMIQCIVFSVFFGVSAGVYSRQAGDDTLVRWLKAINGACMHIIKIVMCIAPIGIFAMLANVAGAIGFQVVFTAGKFLLCLAIGDAIQFLLFFPVTAWKCGVSPLKMPKKFAKMSFMAITTTSGSVCLPTKMEDEVTKFGISRQVADFTGPITMSMNSCGAVNCYVMVILFASQATGTPLAPTQLGFSILLAALMCMGTITVPGGLVATLTLLVTTMGMPVESIALLIGIDWFSGMFRTLMNVDVDVLVGMLVSKKIGEFDADVYNEKKTVSYETTAAGV